MSSQLVAAMPCSVWSPRVAPMIRRRVCATADALRVISYFRGDISLTNFLRVRIVAAAVVLPKSLTRPVKEALMSTPASIAPQSPTARGQQRWFFGMLAEVKASAADTGGRYTLLEMTAPAGLQTPLHVHYREDEGFYVLDGTVTIQVGDETVELGRGQHAFGPARHPAPVHRRPRRRPHDLRPHAWRLRGLRRGGERAGRRADRPPRRASCRPRTPPRLSCARAWSCCRTESYRTGGRPQAGRRARPRRPPSGRSGSRLTPAP